MTDDPLFPGGIGEVLHALLNPQPQPGPPYVHTIEPPRCDLEDCCDTDEPCSCACHRVQPTHTITEVEFATEPYGEPQPGEHRLTVAEAGRYQVEKRLTE